MVRSETPEVSVLMPVYNCEKYLAESIQSILGQTFSNFELIIINDGSKDRSGEVALSFADPRIKYFEQKNIGLANTLNRGLSLAKAELIARQDQDDISLPERFAKQVAFFKAHTEVALLGTSADIIEVDRPSGRVLSHPTKNRVLQGFLCFDNPFVHSSVMFKKSAVFKVGGYRSEKEFQPEDYDLWMRLARQFSIANLPERLLVYREVSSSMSRSEVLQFPNVPNMAAGQIWNLFGKVFPLAWLKAFSRNLRYGQQFSKKKAFFYLFVLTAIGVRFGFDPKFVRPGMRRCLNQLGILRNG